MANIPMKTIRLHGLDDTYTIPTAPEHIGAAPVGLIDGIGSYPSYADFMVNLKSIYGNMPTKTKRFLCMNLQASGDMSNGELGGGTWFVELNKVDNRYGYAEATSYSGTGKVRIHRQEIFDSEWNGWKDDSRDAFAPAGYGLGVEQPIALTSADDALANGWYNVPDPRGGGGTGWLVCSSYSTRYKRHDFYNVGTFGDTHLVRWMDNGVWSEWEWDNPPMVLGTEYRTTKRHKGKVVYAKAISIGKMPVSSARYDNLVTGVDEVVDYIFTMSSYQERYTNNSHVKTLGRNTSAGSVFAEIVTDVNISSFDAYLTISYTKV